MLVTNLQRRSLWGHPCPRGHILKSLASKVKSLALASRPQVLKNWPVLGSRIALFFELLKFCRSLEKNFRRNFLLENAWKKILKTLVFWGGDRLKKIFEDFFSLENTCAWVLGLWPWPRAFLSLASGESVLGRAVLGLGLGFFCVLGLGLGLEPCALDSTSANLCHYY